MTKTNKIILFFVFLIVGNTLAQDRPNILWITIEDTSPHFIGCYGNENASTPNIDKLAEEGIRFTNAFSTGTVCSVSRSTIITGVPTYKSGTGHHRSTHTIPSFIKGFPYFLKNAGYYTSNNVKTDYNIANERAFINEAWNVSSGTASWSSRNSDTQPFFSVFNFADSHQSRTMTNSYQWYLNNVLNNLPVNDRISDDGFDMPPFYNDTPAMRKQFARVYNSIKLTDNKIGDLLKKLEEDNLTENTIIFFYADHGEGIPRAKTNGINLGYRVPFIVKFPEKYKHLSPWGEGGTTTDELISFEDLAPTIINLAGGNAPDYLKGRTLIGEKRSVERKHLLLSADRADNGPDLVRTITDGRYMYSRVYMPYMPEVRYINYFEVGDITKEMRLDFKNNTLNKLQKSIFEERPAEMLYDIENDLWETKNLVDDSQYSVILKEMREKLDEKILESKDIHFMPEFQIKSISSTTTPYEYRLTDNYPFETIYEVASLSGKKGEDIAKQQSEFSNNENPIVRYWATFGFMSQESTITELYKTELVKKLDDSYAPVQTTAAAILYKQFSDETSKNILKSNIRNFSFYKTFMTLNYLIYIKDKTPFIQDVENLLNSNRSSHSMIKGGCLDFLSSVNNVPLSTLDVSKENFQIFPTIFTKETNLYFPRKLENASLTIYNSSGIMVKEYRNINTTKFLLKRDNLKSGLYFYSLKESNIKLKSGKLIAN